MEGKFSNIIKGIQFFGQKSDNSIKSIDIGIGTELTREKQNQLQESISPSSETIQALTIIHQGDLSELILNISSDCKELKILSSSKMGEVRPFRRSSGNPPLAFPANWKPKLEKLEWKAGGNVIICDDSLLGHLQDCKFITLCSRGIGSSWVVKLLSLSSLKTVNIPWIVDEAVAEIPMNVPNLKHLFLDQIPRANIGAASFFFQQFQAPKLVYLRVKNLHPKDLSSLPAECSPSSLAIDGLTIEAGEEAAVMLVESIKDWESLVSLKLSIVGSSAFWSSLLGQLQPFSRVNIRAGYQNHFLLPDLQDLQLG